MGVQSGKSPTLGNCGLPPWECWEKHHLGVALMANHKEYYNGESGGFLEVGPW